ncbi:MAG TPA: Gfo/Idh/MocA family oxidoreductase [Stellaceae bacterium]
MRIAVIGCGKQGRRHLAAFARLPAVDGLVVADADDTRTVAAACDNGAVAVPVDDVFADEIDAVVIATPTATHLSLARRAFESGMHVLCEKPFGADPVAARGLAADAAAKGLVGRVGYLYRFAPSIAAARARVRDIGEVEEVRFAIASPGNHASWKHRRESSGGAVHELASHMVDLALWFFGPARLDGMAIERRETRRIIGGKRIVADAEDRVVARLGRSLIEADFAAKRFAQSIDIQGTQGEIHASIEGAPDLYRIQAQSFLAAIAGARRDDACDFADAVQVSQILQAMRAVPATP